MSEYVLVLRSDLDDLARQHMHHDCRAINEAVYALIVNHRREGDGTEYAALIAQLVPS